MPAPSAISWPLSPEGIASSKAARTSSAIGTRASACGHREAESQGGQVSGAVDQPGEGAQIRTGQNYRRGVGGRVRSVGWPPRRKRARDLTRWRRSARPVRRWFEASFEGPTPAQAGGWEAISGGANALICAPTGSGKTLASFLWGIDKLSRAAGARRPGVRLVYVSPLKALSYDIERNLRAPLRGIGAEISVGLRTGDTPPVRAPGDAQNAARHPDHHPRVALPDALLGRARDPRHDRGGDRRRDPRGGPDQAGVAPGVDAGAAGAPGQGRMRGRVLSEQTAGRLRRAPLRHASCPGPADRALGDAAAVGADSSVPGRARSGSARSSMPGAAKELDLEIVVPVEDMSDPGAPAYPNADGVPAEGEPLAHVRSIWPAIYPKLLELVQEHTSTIIFVNNRRAAERLAKRLNELANGEGDTELPATEHAGHVGGATLRSHRRRTARRSPPAQDRGRRDRPRPPRLALPRGADGGRGDAQVRAAAVPRRDLVPGAGDRHGGGRPGDPGRVAEVGQPRAAAGRPRRALARRGLAGAGSSPSSAPTCSSARWSPSGCATGEIEETVIPQNPLDVLAQHLVSMAALDEWEVDEVERLVTASEPFHDLSREQLENVLDMLDGRYPSDRFAELRPRIVWDRTGGHHARPQRRPPAGRHQRRHDPRPRPLRRPPARRPPGRRARRGDGLRGPARPDLPARRDHLADRGDHPRPGDRHPGARRPRRRPLLEGRRDRPPGRARPGDRRLRPRGGLARAGGAGGRVRPRPPRRREPGRLPARAAGGDPRRPLRRDDRGRALPRRDRRLAPLRPLPLRRPRPRRLGPGAGGRRSATSASSRPTRSGPTTASSSTSPTPTSRRPPTWS